MPTNHNALLNHMYALLTDNFVCFYNCAICPILGMESFSEEVSDVSSYTTETVARLKAKLPDYIVKCFIVAGFDTLDVISQMDVSNVPGNSIELIEEYVSREHPECLPGTKFPPGHRLRIKNLVEDVRASEVSRRKRRRTLDRKPDLGSDSSGVSLDRNSTSSSSDSQEQATMVRALRRQVASWQRSQKNTKVRELREYRDFKVTVTLNDRGECVPSIFCQMCQKKMLSWDKARPDPTF